MSQTPDGTPFSNDMSGIPPPYGFPSNFDDLTESDLSAANFDPFRTQLRSELGELGADEPLHLYKKLVAE